MEELPNLPAPICAKFGMLLPAGQKQDKIEKNRQIFPVFRSFDGERRRYLAGRPYHRALFLPGPAGHRGGQRQIRRLLPGGGPKHSGPAPGRGGMRFRHLAAGLERHPTPASRPAEAFSGPHLPKSGPAPLGTGAGAQAGRWADGAFAGGAGGMRRSRRRPGGTKHRPGSWSVTSAFFSAGCPPGTGTSFSAGISTPKA